MIILSSWSKLSIPALFLNVFKAEISRVLKDMLGFLFKWNVRNALDKSGIKSLSLDNFGGSKITALFSFSKKLSSTSFSFSKKMIFILFAINSFNNFLLSLYFTVPSRQFSNNTNFNPYVWIRFNKLLFISEAFFTK